MVSSEEKQQKISGEVKRREPGKRVYPADDYPKLVLVPPVQQPKLPDVRTELSPEVKEMLREMNQRHAGKGNTDTPDAA